jgi:AraC-like DNA-binding protein
MNLFGVQIPKILECRRFTVPKEAEGDTTKPRLTKHFELDLDIQGNRHLTLDGIEYITEPGSIVFRRPGQFCTSSGGYDMFMLTFEWTEEEVQKADYARNSPKIYNRTIIPEDILPLPHVFMPEHGAELLAIYKRLSVIYRQPSRQSITDLQLSKLLFLVCSDAASYELRRSEEDTPTDRILSYINTHYMENITLEDLANHVHLSRHYLVHLLRKETGRTPFDFILATRLEQAKRLLSCTSLSVADIAEQCGFESSSYFCRRFRMAYGITPRTLREKKSTDSE